MARTTHAREIRQTLMARYRAAYEVKNGQPIPTESRPNYLGSGWYQIGSEKVRTQALYSYLEGMDIYALDAMKA